MIIGIGEYLREQGFPVDDKDINKRALLKFNIYYDPEDEVAGYTTGKTITINTGCEFFKNKYVSMTIMGILGVVYHECGHILFTDFPSRELWIRQLQAGKFEVPDNLPDELHPNAAKILEWMNNPILRQFFTQIAMDIENCVEDGYEENECKAAYPGTVTTALCYNKSGLLHLAKGMDEQIAENPDYPLVALRNQILLYAKAYTVTDVDFDSEEGKALAEVMNVIDSVSHERIPQKRRMAVNHIMIILEPFIEKELKEIIENQPEDQSDSQDGQDGNSEQQRNGNQHGSGNGNGDGSQSQSEQSEQDSQSEGSSQNGSSQSNNRSSSNSGTEMGSKEQSLSNVPDEVLRKAVEKLIDMLNKGNDVSRNDSAPKGIQSGSMTNPTLMRNSGGKEEAPDSSDTSDFSEQLDRVQKFLKDLAKQELTEKTDREEAQAEQAEAFLHGFNFERPEVTSEAKEKYRTIYNEVRGVSNSLRERILEAFQNRRETTKMKHLIIGKRFDAKSVVTGDGRYFQTTRLPVDKPKLRVDVLIDQSGSTVGETIQMERKAAVAVVDFCAALDVAIRVIGYHSNNLIMYCDPKSGNAKIDKYRLGSDAFQPSGGTPTAEALAYAIPGLAKSSEECKLMLVLTDGYSNEGKDAVQKQISIARRKGITVIAMGLGSYERHIKDEFGENNFVCISNLSELPKSLIKLITRYMPLY